MKRNLILIGLLEILFSTFLFFSCKKTDIRQHSEKEIEQLRKELGEEFEDGEIVFNSPEVQEELNDFIENPEKLMDFVDDRYIAYLNDVYMFPDAYTGHKILVQGQYKKMTYDFGKGTHTVDYIFRETKGCEPGSIIPQGFEFLKPATFKAPLNEGDWIEISGTIEPYEEKDLTFVRLKADKLKKLSEPGNLFVE